jgi:hypothetical protein
MPRSSTGPAKTDSPAPTPILAALNALRAQLATETTFQDISSSLAELESLKLSKFDLIVHIERWRAVNDLSVLNLEDDDLFEENCLEALDLLHKSDPELHSTINAR